MVGQYKSTVICSTCSKVSVCFDPFLMTSLSIPSNQEWVMYFIPLDLSRGAIRLEFEFNPSTTLRMIYI